MNFYLQWKGLWLAQGPVRHHTSEVFPVVVSGGNHAVLAGHSHGVVRTWLGCYRGVSIGGGHPDDLGSGAAVHGLTACHDDQIRACLGCDDGGRVLGLSWWMDGAGMEGGCRRDTEAERRLKDAEIDKMEIRQLKEKIMCTIIDKQFESPVWQKQIQNLSLQTSSAPHSPFPSRPPRLVCHFSLERAYIDKQLQAPEQTNPNPKSSFTSFYNLFPLYPHHPPSINYFPVWCGALRYTDSKSVQISVCHHPLRSTSHLFNCPLWY